MAKVLNKKTLKSGDVGVYIGRGSKWGNPFVIGKHGNREEVIQKYKDYYNQNEFLQKSIGELKGKNLICWCAPLACHGDFLLEKTYVCD